MHLSCSLHIVAHALADPRSTRFSKNPPLRKPITGRSKYDSTPKGQRVVVVVAVVDVSVKVVSVCVVSVNVVAVVVVTVGVHRPHRRGHAPCRYSASAFAGPVLLPVSHCRSSQPWAQSEASSLVHPRWVMPVVVVIVSVVVVVVVVRVLVIVVVVGVVVVVVKRFCTLINCVTLAVTTFASACVVGKMSAMMPPLARRVRFDTAAKIMATVACSAMPSAFSSARSSASSPTRSVVL